MRYRTGQRWQYKTRPGEEGSRITILRVENVPDLGELVFIAIDGLRVADATAPGGTRATVSFAAFAEAAMEESTLSLEATADTPEHQALYSGWRRAFEDGKAAAFTRTVAEAIDSLQENL